MSEHVTGMDLAAWLDKKAHEQEIETVVLPSGLQCDIYRHVSIEKLIFNGQILVDILPAAVVQSKEGKVELDRQEIMDNLGDFMPMIDAVFRAAMARPQIGDTTDAAAGIVGMSMFDNEVGDKIFVLGKVMGEVNTLARFPGTNDAPPAIANGAAAQHRENVLSTTGGAAGD